MVLLIICTNPVTTIADLERLAGDIDANYLKKLVLPEELSHIKFDKKLYKRTVKYLKKNDPKHIFIYGEVDPWTSSGVAGWLDCKKKNNMKIYVQPNGSHKARISNMPEPMKSEIIRTLTKWLQ